MKKITLAFVLISYLSAHTNIAVAQLPGTVQSSQEDVLGRSRSTIESVSKKTEDIIHGSGTDAEKKAQFVTLFESDFNVPAIAKHVFRSYWKSATDVEKKEYVSLFTQDIVGTYFSLLKKYYEKKEQLVILRVEPSKRAKNACDVYSEARNPDNNRKITLKWQLLNGKILDVIVDRASMSNAKAREYKDLMRKSGKSFPTFLKALREKGALTQTSH